MPDNIPPTTRSRSNFPRLPRKIRLALAGIGLVGSLWGVGRMFGGPEQHPDPQPFMKHPENMAGVRDTLKKFAPDAAQRLNAKNIKTHFVYTSAMTQQSHSHFTDKNQEKLQKIVARFEEDGKQDNLVFGLISHFEGVRPKSYDDSENIRTIGCGYVMSKPRKISAGHQEKFMRKTLGIDETTYDALYDGTQSLSMGQIRKLTMDWVRQKGGIREQLAKTLDKASGEEGAISRIDPLHKAFLLTMLYQSPAALRGMGKTAKETRATTYPLLAILSDKSATPEKREKAMIALNDYCATNTQLKFGNKEQARNPNRIVYCQRSQALNALMIPDTVASASPDLLAAQIHVACRHQQHVAPGKTALVIVAGRPMNVTVQQILENKACMWNTSGEAEIIFAGLGVTARQNGNEITVSSWTDKDYGYEIEIEDSGNSAVGTMHEFFQRRREEIVALR